MADLGYLTHNSIINLKTIFWTIVLYLIRIAIVCSLYLLKARKSKYYSKDIKNLFYNELIVLSIQGYLELLICGYLSQ